MQSWVANHDVHHLIIGGIIVVVFWLLTWVVKWTLIFIGRKIFARTETVLDDRILRVVLANVQPLMVVIGLRLAVREVWKGADAGETTLQQILEYAEALLYIVLAVLVLWILLGILREVITWYLERLSHDGTSDLKNTLAPLITTVMNVVIGLVAVIIILDHFGINIGSFLVSLGVGSLAVALAAQETLANMIAGFVILADRPFRVGDRIELSTGQVGDVAEIGLRSAKMINFDNNLIVILNGELIKSRIVNFSKPAHPMRVLLRFDVAYGTEIDIVRALLLRPAQSHPDLVKDPAPQVFVTGVSEIAVQLTLVARASSYTKQWDAEAQLRENTYKAFLEQGIHAPVQRRIVQMQTDSPSPA
jgi:small-conductance mechanosensitive channel